MGITSFHAPPPSTTPPFQSTVNYKKKCAKNRADEGVGERGGGEKRSRGAEERRSRGAREVRPQVNRVRSSLAPLSCGTSCIALCKQQGSCVRCSSALLHRSCGGRSLRRTGMVVRL